MIDKIFGKFSRDLGIDLGTSSTLIYVKEKGIIIDEPSVVALNNKTHQILAVGKDAQRMIGKTPYYIQAITPLEKGIISDFEVTEKMLKFFINKVHQGRFGFVPRPRVVIGISLDITEVERKAVEDAVISAGAREVLLCESLIAAAIGARLPIQDPIGSMIVGLGGGTTEIGVVSLGGIVSWKSVKIAGNDLNQDIIQYVRSEFNVLLGEKVAEMAKMKIGSAFSLEEPLEMRVRGRDLISGLPKEIIVSDGQIREALSRSIRLIIDDIKATLELTPPELVADIYEKGMVLSGGGAMLRGMDQAIAKATQIPVGVADDPITATVRGTGIIVEDFENLKGIIIPSTQQESAL
ncbi:MAG: rod shape-determining protein MreB [Parcubacteria group bacterium Gr01-1014_18]|nr:MAG: rod shape-determining protein MreB [Parcubacteria group bacterium Greene0416_36]TSC81522.1 MAG: rod shape-determining protein MreB [Parcubacteria group bacterium Gr01-1014_18]TSC99667.1 MAG: rod shape-determining protein MreB [Parcubacteria group bacterium Greene1014_20]TSD07118.1 MAG: rod shape-determining protein MreB [Parcubacteria group bacterium Greene0714_2]